MGHNPYFRQQFLRPLPFVLCVYATAFICAPNNFYFLLSLLNCLFHRLKFTTPIRVDSNFCLKQIWEMKILCENFVLIFQWLLLWLTTCRYTWPISHFPAHALHPHSHMSGNAFQLDVWGEEHATDIPPVSKQQIKVAASPFKEFVGLLFETQNIHGTVKLTVKLICAF